MIVTCVVENGVVRLPAGIVVPDGMRLEVSVPDERRAADGAPGPMRPAPEGATPAEEVVPPFAERFAKYIGDLDGLPEDLAENHDHYLYGVPKRK